MSDSLYECSNDGAASSSLTYKPARQQDFQNEMCDGCGAAVERSVLRRGKFARV